MTKPFDVHWTESAVRDFERIVEFLEVDSPQAAVAMIDSIDVAALSLTSMPNRGRWVPELERLGIRAYRELVVSTYRLIYRVQTPGRVYVMAVLDGRQDLETLLSARLLES